MKNSRNSQKSRDFESQNILNVEAFFVARCNQEDIIRLSLQLSSFSNKKDLVQKDSDFADYSDDIELKPQKCNLVPNRWIIIVMTFSGDLLESKRP